MVPLQAYSNCFSPLDSGQCLLPAQGLSHHGHLGMLQRQRQQQTRLAALQPATQPINSSSSSSSSIHSRAGLRRRSVRCWARKGKQAAAQEEQQSAATDAPERLMLKYASSDEENPAVYVAFDPETMDLVPKYVVTEELLDGLDGVDVASSSSSRPGATAAAAADSDGLSVPDLRVISDEEEVGLIGEGLPIINGVSVWSRGWEGVGHMRGQVCGFDCCLFGPPGALPSSSTDTHIHIQPAMLCRAAVGQQSKNQPQLVATPLLQQDCCRGPHKQLLHALTC